MRMTISVHEASDFIGVSYWLLLELAKQGKIPHVRVGKRVLFRIETLEQWMEQQEMESIKKSESQDIYGALRKIDFKED